MFNYKKLEDYISDRDNGIHVEATHATLPTDKEVSGVELDSEYRSTADYDKMLEFLRGKKNTPDITDKPVPPKGVAKGWFVVDEASKGLWNAENREWSHDAVDAELCIFKNESAAQATASVVGGLIIPVEEILG